MAYEPVRFQNIPEQVSEYINKGDQEESKRVVANIAVKLKKETKEKTRFPIDAFPSRIQNIIQVFYECYKLPPDYHCAAILAAASVAIGNAFSAYFKKKQSYPPILYLSVVGYPSSGKSPGIDFGLFPLEEIEKELREEHRDRIERWKEECYKASLDKKELPEKPVSQDLIIDDATRESINRIMSNNPKGVILVQDELKAWIKSMDMYRSKGSDLEYWLKIWSGKSVKVNRTSDDVIWLPYPFASVIGGIQPGVLKDMATGGKADNGFLARILFAYPDEMIKPFQTDEEPHEKVLDLYRKMIKFLYRLPNNFETEKRRGVTFAKVIKTHVPLSEEGKKIYIKFIHDYTQQYNESESEEVKGILGKLEQYCLRFALIIEMLEFACSKAPEFTDDLNPMGEFKEVEFLELEDLEISKSSVEKAIRITSYFKRTALKVIDQLDSPVAQLGTYIETWYNEMPEQFHTNVALDVGKKINKQFPEAKLSESTIKRLLNNQKGRLFERVGRGLHRKVYI